MTKRGPRPLHEVDGNSDLPDGRPASRFHGLAKQVVVGGVVLDTDAIDFEDCVRFRYRVVGFGFMRWRIVREDRRPVDQGGTATLLLHRRYLFRELARDVCGLLNDASDLATEDGWR
jgi:hypothetical protein